MHLLDHIRHHSLAGENILHVVAVVSNPVRYQSRYRLARQFVESVQKAPCVRLHLVEACFGDRLPEVADSSNPDHLIVRTESEIWIKENMINLGMRRVLVNHPEARYLAWVDADVEFRDLSWAQETIHALQHFPLVQPWSDCLDLNFAGGVTKHFKSFGAQHQRRAPKQMSPDQPYEYAHSGFAWACTRGFWEASGGLMDFAILGSADHHMAFAAIGEVKNTIHGGMCEAFKRRCHQWQDRALRSTLGEVGFTAGRIEHQFHGPKRRRYYRERWQILVDHGFDPDRHLTYDHQGVLQLVGKPALEQAIRQYNRSRYEDSIEEF